MVNKACTHDALVTLVPRPNSRGRSAITLTETGRRSPKIDERTSALRFIARGFSAREPSRDMIFQ